MPLDFRLTCRYKECIKQLANNKPAEMETEKCKFHEAKISTGKNFSFSTARSINCERHLRADKALLLIESKQRKALRTCSGTYFGGKSSVKLICWASWCAEGWCVKLVTEAFKKSSESLIKIHKSFCLFFNLLSSKLAQSLLTFFGESKSRRHTKAKVEKVHFLIYTSWLLLKLSSHHDECSQLVKSFRSTQFNIPPTRFPKHSRRV